MSVLYLCVSAANQGPDLARLLARITSPLLWGPGDKPASQKGCNCTATGEWWKKVLSREYSCQLLISISNSFIWVIKMLILKYFMWLYFRSPRWVSQHCVNSLGPSDAIWLQRSGSTLAQVMACCLTAPSHYLNQCWLIISEVQWHSYLGTFTRDASTINHENKFENYISKILLKSPRGQWVFNPLQSSDAWVIFSWVNG